MPVLFKIKPDCVDSFSSIAEKPLDAVKSTMVLLNHNSVLGLATLNTKSTCPLFSGLLKSRPFPKVTEGKKLLPKSPDQAVSVDKCSPEKVAPFHFGIRASRK